MQKMCYNLDYLRKYEDKPFIHERKSFNIESIYSFKTVIQETEKCLVYFQKYDVKNNTGIAVDLKEHSAASCILLLGILNHDCHFYCMDFEETKDVNTCLRSSGVNYIISLQNLKSDNIAKQFLNAMTVLDNVFYLYSLESNNNILQSVRLCYTIATSGSTGQPKMVHVPYECIEPNIKSLSHLLNIQGNDMIFLGSPHTFDPFVVEFFLALENGARVLITSKAIRLQPNQLIKIMFPEMKTLNQSVTVYQTTPSLFRLFGKPIIQNRILNKSSSLRCLLLGGEEFPSSFELKSWLPLDFFQSEKRIFNVYGITEVSCWSSIFELNAKTIDTTNVPLGSTMDNLTLFRLVDDLSNVLHHNDCKGELEIGSSTRRCFLPEHDNDVNVLEGQDIIFRKTGDLVERDVQGNIYYIGRTNNSIKRFGKRLCLDSLNKKVEILLNANEMPCQVICLWNDDASKLMFYLVNNKKMLYNVKELLSNILKESLETYEQPDKIFYGDKLPLNCHGKVDRKKIMQQTTSLSAKSPAQIFKDFLANVLGFQLDMDSKESNVSVTTSKRIKLSANLNFINAGGTSFQALSLATEIAELIEEGVEQRKILEMLLDNNVTIKDILAFLISCPRQILCQGLPNESLQSFPKNFNLRFMWRGDLKKCIDASPSVYGDKYVSVGAHSHILLTVDASTGEEISRLELNDRIECPVVFASSHLALVGCYDGFLYGFDFNNGTILWQLNAKGMIKAKPLIIQNMIIIASYAADYNVLAFDIKSLALVWSLKLGSKGIFSSPLLITAESVLVCCLDGTYALLEVQTGSVLWLEKLDTPIFSTPTKIQLADETLLVLAEVKGEISICKAESGKRITSFQTGGNIFSGLTLLHQDHKKHTFIIFGCHDKNVYCLKMDHESKQLSLLSKVTLNAAVYSTPVVVLKRYTIACSTKGLIVLLDLLASTILASTDIKAEVFSTPSCLNDEYIYVGSRDNHLYCFQIEQ